MIGMNTGNSSAAETPFGGIKESGYGKESGKDVAVAEYMVSTISAYSSRTCDADDRSLGHQDWYAYSRGPLLRSKDGNSNVVWAQQRSENVKYRGNANTFIFVRALDLNGPVAHAFDVVQVAAHGGQILAAIFLDHDVVFDPDTSDAPVTIQHALIDDFFPYAILEFLPQREFSEVDARFVCDDRVYGKLAAYAQVAEERIWVFVVCVSAAVVGIHAQVVAKSVREKASRDLAVEDLLDGQVLVKDAEIA